MSLVLLETMRAGTGRVPWLGRHLDRMCASARAWEIHDMPTRDELEAAVVAAMAGRAGDARVRLVAPTADPAGCRVEMTSEAPLARVPPAVRAVSLRGGWRPTATAWQHKVITQTEQRVRLRARFAETAERVLLLDNAGNLGEADLANGFAVIRGRAVTPPVRGLLPGITREVLIAHLDAQVRDLSEREWRLADELFLTSAVSGVVAVVQVDGRPIGRGQIGPVTRRAQELLIEEWSAP